jgi:hypothetical protein
MYEKCATGVWSGTSSLRIKSPFCLSSHTFFPPHTLRSSTVTLRLLYISLPFLSCFFIFGGGTTGIFYIFGALLACCLLAWDYTYFGVYDLLILPRVLLYCSRLLFFVYFFLWIARNWWALDLELHMAALGYLFRLDTYRYISLSRIYITHLPFSICP